VGTRFVVTEKFGGEGMHADDDRRKAEAGAVRWGDDERVYVRDPGIRSRRALRGLSVCGARTKNEEI